MPMYGMPTEVTTGDHCGADPAAAHGHRMRHHCSAVRGHDIDALKPQHVPECQCTAAVVNILKMSLKLAKTSFDSLSILIV